MIEVSEEEYRIADVLGFADETRLSVLKQVWGFEPHADIHVTGRLKAIPAATKGGTFYVLEQLHNAKDGSALRYPLKDLDPNKHTVFVGKLPQKLFSDTGPEGRWVSAAVVFSPAAERAKHDNPFALSAVSNTIKPLTALQISHVTDVISVNGQQLVEEWVCDAYLSANLVKLTAIVADEQKRADAFLTKNDQLQQQITLQESSLSKLNNAFQSTIRQKQQTEAELKQLKIDMEYRMNTLRQFVEHRAQLLMELDLISQQDYDTLSGKNLHEQPFAGHGVKEVFDGKLPEAIKYVQAYMFNKGTVYRRAVLEDYFTLLSTHDLIVLAGDSGSGKTNLVKSFAEATGGKAIIIPVKPNWTSAEDLLGYYNPLEKKFLSTPFLDALLEAAQNPNVPYYICLDEMNLARVEYYFADFLSYLEERSAVPEIPLFSDTEAQHLVSEAKNFLSLITEVKQQLNDTKASSFLDLLRDDALNAKLHEMCGFSEGESLLKYHAYLRRLFSSYLSMPSRLVFPSNVRVIGAINVDETTHYLSPKILDRAHIMRFSSPLLSDWESIEAEIASFDIDINLPVLLKPETFGLRQPYPQFAPKTELVKTLIEIVKSYLEPLGIEFGLRTVRQAQNYAEALKIFDTSDDVVLNNIILHKVLPKLMFDGEKVVEGEITRKDILKQFRDRLAQDLQGVDADKSINCISELDRVLKNAEANDWVVNYWSR